MTWLLALVLWTAFATVVAPIVGRVLAYDGQPRSVSPRVQGSRSPIRFPAQLSR